MDKKYCLVAYSFPCVDQYYIKDKEGNVIPQKMTGGISCLNVLYNITLLRNNVSSYIVGAVGNDKNGEKALESLENVGVNTDYVKKENRKTNVFHIIIPEEITEDDSVEISEVSPLTGVNTYSLPQEFKGELPKELEGKRIILCISNFEKSTMDFINQAKEKCKECVINLDVTKEKIFKEFSNEYIEELLNKVDMVQINNKTFKALYNKLNFEDGKNESESEKKTKFFEKFKFDLLTITNGSKGATFLYNEEEHVKQLDMETPKVYDMKDPTGAGDAFNSIMTMFYQDKILENNSQIDEKFLRRSFNTANKFVGLVVNQVGARLERRDKVSKREVIR